jgi:uncharacterized coiled-coil protein SlyX
MMFGFLSGFKTYIILGLAITSVVGAAYWYYTDTQKAFKTYADNKSVMEQALFVQSNAITQLTQDFERMQSTMTDLNEKFTESRKQVVDLENKFNKSKSGDSRDFGEIGAKKPKLVEKIINSAVDKTANCFEILSGAKGDYDEKEYNSCVGSDYIPK